MPIRSVLRILLNYLLLESLRQKRLETSKGKSVCSQTTQTHQCLQLINHCQHVIPIYVTPNDKPFHKQISKTIHFS